MEDSKVFHSFSGPRQVAIQFTAEQVVPEDDTMNVQSTLHSGVVYVQTPDGPRIPYLVTFERRVETRIVTANEIETE